MEGVSSSETSVTWLSEGTEPADFEKLLDNSRSEGDLCWQFEI